jgi:hypothetical protein
MSEYPNEPMLPGSGPEMSLIDTWIDAFTKPREETYARIVAQPGASATKAFLWVFLASLLTSHRQPGRQFWRADGNASARCCRLRSPTSCLQVRRCFGRDRNAASAERPLARCSQSSLLQLALLLYSGWPSSSAVPALSTNWPTLFHPSSVPYSLVAAVLALLSMIPFVGILTGLISFAMSIYVIVLEVLAVKAVNRLDTGKAVGAVLLPALAIFLIVCCCLAIGLSLYWSLS